MITAHVFMTYMELRSAVSAGLVMHKKDQIMVNESPMNCEFTAQFWTVCAVELIRKYVKSI